MVKAIAVGVVALVLGGVLAVVGTRVVFSKAEVQSVLDPSEFTLGVEPIR
jgi:hypothetical protein